MRVCMEATKATKARKVTPSIRKTRPKTGTKTAASAKATGKDRSGVGDRMFKNATRIEVKEKHILNQHSKRTLKLSHTLGARFEALQGRWLVTSMSNEEDIQRHLSRSPWVVDVPGRSDGAFFTVERARMEGGRLHVQGSMIPTSVKKKEAVNAPFTIDHVACQDVAPLVVQN